MPLLIEHIDAIARKKQRDVLLVRFNDPDTKRNDFSGVRMPPLNWRVLPIRQTLIEWLDANQIEWDLCGSIANVKSMTGYRGQIYIDLPADPSSPKYQRLVEFLEYPDGTFRFAEAELCCLRLETAMANAAHDEPEFWALKADGF